MKKRLLSLLFAMLQPDAKMKELQDTSDFTALMVLSEEAKTLPFGDIWAEYLNRQKVESDYLNIIKEYEEKVLVNRK